MPTVDTNDKVWGLKAKYHFYLYAGAYAVFSLVYLMAIIDYAQIPSSETSKDDTTTFLAYMGVIPVRMMMGMAMVALLLCPNHIWYGICSVFLLTYSVSSVLFGTLRMVRDGNWQGEEEDGERSKFPNGQISEAIFGYVSSVWMFYMGVVLFKLSFMYTPKPDEDDMIIVHTPPPQTIISFDQDGNPKVTQSPCSPSIPLAPPPTPVIPRKPEVTKSPEAKWESRRSKTDSTEKEAKSSRRSEKKSKRSVKSEEKDLQAEKSSGSQKTQKTSKSSKSVNSSQKTETVKFAEPEENTTQFD